MRMERISYIKEMKALECKQPVNAHDAILFVTAAWDAMKPETIQNSLKKAGF